MRINLHVALVLLLASAVNLSAKPPNILWLSIEDTGQEVEPYDKYARTPNIARLAREGVTFLNAFSHSPVCAPTRSGIITGMYPTSIGTQNMRSDGVPPAFVKAFPEYLRRLGYYTTNNSKTDYNFPTPITAWDESSRQAHWKNRPDKDQPFFAVFNFNSSHEGGVRRQFAARTADAANKIHDASRLLLPPYYPDTPKVREAWAAYYDVVTQTDVTIGKMIKELEDEGILEDTVVFFWGDHGVGLARAKRWPYDSGVKVPLIVRWPDKVKPGTIRTDFVQFLDLAPTVIDIAGGKAPGHMHGRVIVGDNQGPEPKYLYHARDRMDERYDMIRAVRNSRYLYLRNFESHKPWVQFMRTPSQGPIYKELGRLKDEGGLDHITGLFMADTKPHEELYDVVADPYQIHNLASDGTYDGTLKELRAELLSWMKRTNDHGLIPEPELYRTAFPSGERAVTAKPTVRKSAGQGDAVKITLMSETEGASLAYKFATNDGWQLYNGPVPIKKGQTLTAVAARLGYKDSAPVTVSAE